MREKKVLIITQGFSPNIGGIETHLDNLCDYLSQRGHKVFVATYQPLLTKARGPKIERKGNIEIHRISWVGINWYYKLEAFPPLLFAYLFPGLFFESFSLLFKHRKEIGVLHAHGLVPAFVARILARVFRKRIVMSTHTVYGLKPGTFLARAVKWVLSPFDTILPLAQNSKNELVAIGLPEERINVYTHWVDLETFKPLDRRQCKDELRLGERFVALFVGRFVEIKGVNVILEAAALVNPTISFAFVGDGPLADKILEKAKLLPNVINFGKVPNEQLPKYYNSADVFLCPSQYEEGFGRVIAEALACGLPVLASSRGTLPEIVTSAVGETFEMSPKNLAQALNRLFEHPEALARMRANCTAYALEHFSEQNAEVIINAYEGDRNLRAGLAPGIKS